MVLRQLDGRREVLAFTHPNAGRQFVKGTIESGESPLAAARRELCEESGLYAPSVLTSLGVKIIGTYREPWHFFTWISTGLPDAWSHQTKDDHGHTFRFFWHPLDVPLGDEWHFIFPEAFNFFAPLVSSDGSYGTAHAAPSSARSGLLRGLRVDVLLWWVELAGFVDPKGAA